MRYQVIITIMLLALVACAPEAVLKPEAPIYNGPVTSEVLASRIAFINVSGLRAEIKARLEHQGRKTATVQGVMVARPPQGLRLLAFGPLGMTMMDAVYYSGAINILVPKQNAVYSATAPSLWPATPSALRMHEEPTAYYLYETVDTPGGPLPVREYVFDHETLLNTSAAVFVEGHPVFIAEFSEFDPKGRPTSVVMDMPGSLRATLQIIEPDYVTEVPERKFEMSMEGRLLLPLSSLKMEE